MCDREAFPDVGILPAAPHTLNLKYPKQQK